MIPSMRAYLQAAAAVANARANLPTAIDDHAQRALDDANAAADRVRNGLLASPFNLSGFGNGLTFLPVDGFNDGKIELDTSGVGRTDGKKSIRTFEPRRFQHQPGVAVVAVDLHEPLDKADLFADFTITDNSPAAMNEFVPLSRVDPVRLQANLAKLSASFALHTGSAFEKAVYAIAYLEQRLRRLCARPTMPCGDNFNFKIRELPNDADAHALTALQQTRAELHATPPETDDRLVNSYYQWVLADLEYERLQAQARLPRAGADGDNDGMAEATRIRQEALAAFVAAAA